ncbi:MAG: pseudaminic acid synthase [Candidatus Marinimicrobia bacterium]|nr:pseudaminic acid synthase [Candidatus Neomarinimicrobiota bacterium]
MNREEVYIIAELSANHNNRLETALETIQSIKNSGADAVKLQTYTADTITIDCDNEHFTNLLNGTVWEGKKFYDLYKEAYTPWEWHDRLFKYARNIGLDIFSSPFDISAIDFLEELNPSYYKIASFEIYDIPLIECAASKGRPIIISTGIATLGDIELALKTCREVGNNQITLLKCTSAYPAPIEEANLLTIPNMRDTFGVEVGLSDHTLGSSVSIAAVALGAKVIEKHFILDRNMGGPDSSFSMEPEEFKSMVKSIREVESSLGRINYELTEKAEKSKVFARSLFIVEDVKAGDEITGINVRSIRPAYGMHPKYYAQVMGNRFAGNYKKGTPLEWAMVVE